MDAEALQALSTKQSSEAAVEAVKLLRRKIKGKELGKDKASAVLAKY